MIWYSINGGDDFQICIVYGLWIGNTRAAGIEYAIRLAFHVFQKLGPGRM